MAAKPPLPDDYELTSEINGWHHTPDSSKNAHVWTDADDTTCVAVFEFDDVYAKVIDTRAGAGRELFRTEFDSGDATGVAYTDAKREHVCDGIERAIEWMETTAPEQWSHPEVCEAVFDTPAGYELARYFHGNRESTIYYQRVDTEDVTRLAGIGEPDEYTVETCPYLYLHVWNGSGNATVALAPWLHAHGPSSKHPEVQEVVETPEECGLEVAVTMARQFAREHHDGEGDASASRQSDLNQFQQTARTDGGEKP